MRNKSKKLIAIMAAMMIAGSTVAATATVASAATITNNAYYQITFDSMGGSAVAPQRVKATDTASRLTVNEPTAPTLAGYTFAGLYSDVNYTKPVTFTAGTATVAAADWDDTFTLYAKWNKAAAQELTAEYAAATGVTAKLSAADADSKYLVEIAYGSHKYVEQGIDTTAITAGKAIKFTDATFVDGVVKANAAFDTSAVAPKAGETITVTVYKQAYTSATDCYCNNQHDKG